MGPSWAQTLSTSGCALGPLLDPAEIEFPPDPAPMKLRSTERGLLGSSLESSMEGSPGPSQDVAAKPDASGLGRRVACGQGGWNLWPPVTVPARCRGAAPHRPQARVQGTEHGPGSGCRRAGERREHQETRAQLLHMHKTGRSGPRSSQPWTPGGAQGCLFPPGHLETGGVFLMVTVGCC